MGIKVIVKNSRAGYDFFLEEKFEAGVEALEWSARLSQVG